MFIGIDVTTPEGVSKKQIYESIGMQDFETWEIVQIRQYIGEFSKADILEQKTRNEWIVTRINDQIALFE